MTGTGECGHNSNGHYGLSRPESGFRYIHHIVSEAREGLRLSPHNRNPVLNTGCRVARIRCTQQA